MRLFFFFFWLLLQTYVVNAEIHSGEAEACEIFDDFPEDKAQTNAENSEYSNFDDDEDEDIDDCELLIKEVTEAEELSQMYFDSEPTSIVNGSVNVITGTYQDGETDFTLVGAAGFSFQRGYISGESPEKSPLGQGWCHNYFAVLKCWRHQGKPKYQASVMESLGAYHVFCTNHKYEYDMRFSCYQNGATNCSSGMMSSRTNVLNNRLHHNPGDPHRHFEKASGSMLTFTRRKKGCRWNLTFEKRPNSICYRYFYDKKNNLEKIESLNWLGKPLGSLEFSYDKGPNENKIINIHSGGHHLACYQFFGVKVNKDDDIKEKKRTDYYLANSITKQTPQVSYTYQNKNKEEGYPLKIIKKSLPNNRFQEIEYYKLGENNVGGTSIKLKSRSSLPNKRVMLQKSPVGHDATPVITHRYFYKYADKYCLKPKAQVYNAHNNLTEYYWNNRDRLKAIYKFTGAKNHNLYSKDKLYWGDQNSRECNLLKAKCFEDANGTVYFVRSFKYDSIGNVLSDTLWGNLTGKNRIAPKVVIEEDDDEESAQADNGCEKLQTTYTYSNSSPSLVTSCKKGNNEEHFYYNVNTDLLLAKLYLFKGKIYKREFYEYNNDAVVTKEISDDGTCCDKSSLEGVTHRYVKYIQVSESYPVGLPLVVEETYNSLDGSGDLLLKKTINTYDFLGQLIKRDIYDSNSCYLCSFRWEYDSMGNVITEVDPLGNTIRRTYDENKNKITEKSITKKCRTDYTYDFSNRLIKIQQHYSDKKTHSQHFKYNTLSQKVSSTDIYGNETRYVYDSLGRLVKTIYPEVSDENGNRITPKEIKNYNELNQVVAVTDARRFVTRQENTLRGTPTHIYHPDGTTESFEYNLDGTVYKQTNKNLCTTVFTYDKLKRPIKTTETSSSGKILSEKTCRYRSFYKTSETDAMGNKTRYFYNRAGKLIEMRKGDLRITYDYDAIGRLYKTTEWDNNGGGQVKVQEFDLLDRVIEERTENTKGNVLTKAAYAYNAEGKRTSTTTYGENGPATTYTFYSARGEPCKLVDAEGNTTHITYRYNYKNEYGQKVPYTESTDPQGNVTITIKDALGRIVLVKKKNIYGKVIQETELFYDACNNKCKQIDKLIQDGDDLQSEIVTEWSYDSMNRLIATIEASKDGKEKISRIEYNKKGQKSAVIKPDNVRLCYSYDALGRLIKHTSSDKSIFYVYTYDMNGNLLSVRDCIANTETLMTYDSNDRLIEEILANGLSVKYTYDGTSKPLKILLPDGSGIGYSYNGLHLTEVQRLSKDETVLYTHKYDAFSQEGKILFQTLIKNSGRASFQYDLKGRTKEIAFPHWQENLLYDNVDNISKRTINDSVGELSCSYKYNNLYQLTAEKSFVDDIYECDSLYNRRTKNGKKYTLNALNELLDDETSIYEYDSNGNLTAKTSEAKELKFSYDALDRLTEAINGSKKASYAYDAQNRRISKILSKKNPSTNAWERISTTNYLYLGQNEVGTYDDLGKPLELRILGIGKGAEIGASIAIEIQGRLFAPIHDSCGNITALIDAESGGIEETHRYTAFGEELIFDGEGAPLHQALSPWSFSSKRYDKETNLVYFGRRYYDPETSRWLTPDPIGLNGGPNLYAYVLNSPLTHFDLYGLYGMTSNFGSWNECATYGLNLLMSALTMPGRALEAIGWHIVPLPIVRDVIEIAGRFLSGQSFNDYVWSCRQHSSSGDLGRPEGDPSQIHVVFNGICTSKEDMIQRCTEMSDSMGGINVHYYHNSTHGGMSDLLESACQLIGIRTSCSDGFYKYLQEKIDSMEGISNARINIHAHSQASIVVNNAQNHVTPKHCKMIDVYTYGAAKLITDSKFHQARNYVSLCDGVPFFLNIYKYTQAQMHPTEEIIFLKSDSFPLIDHAWDGNTYQAALAKNLEKTHKRAY